MIVFNVVMIPICRGLWTENPGTEMYHNLTIVSIYAVQYNTATCYNTLLQNAAVM
jgi:hypothetical protein